MTAKESRAAACAKFNEFWHKALAPRIAEASGNGKFEARISASEMHTAGFSLVQFEHAFHNCTSFGYNYKHTYLYSTYKAEGQLQPMKWKDGVEVYW